MRDRRPRGNLVAMTTTDQFGGYTPPSPTAPAPPSRVLRRSRTDRVGAGVAGGLGEYFSLDPVLFRVLFATASFFGGAGVLAYLVAWAAIPEQDTLNAPIDRFVSELRRRRVPVWLIASIAGLVLWGVAFSWWAPGHFFPVIVLVIVLAAIFGRRGRAGQRSGPQAPGATPTVNLAKESPAAQPDRRQHGVDLLLTFGTRDPDEPAVEAQHLDGGEPRGVAEQLRQVADAPPRLY